MADFFKIFFVLCGLVTAFVFGRNYGETTVTSSKEYIKQSADAARTQASEQRLVLIKNKFQELIDSTDLKNNDAVLSKIKTVLRTDLDIHISEAQEKELARGKEPAQAERSAHQSSATRDVSAAQIKKAAIKIGKYRSQERLLENSQNDFEIKKNLKKLELKSLDFYLKNALNKDLKSSEKYMGAYRGRVFDINEKEYGTLIIEAKPTKNEKDEGAIKGRIVFLKNNREESKSTFVADHFGKSPEGFSGIIVPMGGRQLQVYSIENSKRLAGYFYERLPNGTTKTIGNFILNRVDQF
jgi:hypothetical protein